MQHRKFHLRLDSSYKAPDNDIVTMHAQVLTEGEWIEFSPDTQTPGFLLFVYALFSCQHRYMKTNCAERKLVLSSSHGELNLVANMDWEVQNFEVNFIAKLESGKPTGDDIEYITERMRHCPVSSNLPKDLPISNSVRFE